MPVGNDFKLIKEKSLDKETTLMVSKNIMSGRIFVEYVSVNPKITLQKNFQDTVVGRAEADIFSKKIKNTNQLREYFGIKRDKK